MKKISLLMCCLLVITTFSINAQITSNDVLTIPGVGKMDLSAALTELADGIKPEAFESSWSKNKTTWMSKAKALNFNDEKSASELVTDLFGGLKTSAFIKDFDSKSIINSLGSTGEMSEVVGSLGKLTGGLNKDMLTPEFAKNFETFSKRLQLPEMTK